MITLSDIKKYSLNCLILTLPPLIWNIVLATKLPSEFQKEIFWKDIPTYLKYGENISRIIVFVFTLLMPLHILAKKQKQGLFLYIGGVILYFASWIALIYFPDSAWSKSVFGFMAPAYTPLVWLIAIGLIGDSFYFNLPYRRWVFILLSIIFLSFHNYHTLIIYLRKH
jgi:hypothetical protein